MPRVREIHDAIDRLMTFMDTEMKEPVVFVQSEYAHGGEGERYWCEFDKCALVAADTVTLASNV